MKKNLNYLSLILWVTQFGLSVLFPICFFLFVSVRLQNRYSLGSWVVIALGLLGLLVSVSTARSCIRSLKREAEAAGKPKETVISFNDHN